MPAPTEPAEGQWLQNLDRGQAVLRLERPGAAGDLPLLRRPPHQGPVAARPRGPQEVSETEGNLEESLLHEHGRVGRFSRKQTLTL